MALVPARPVAAAVVAHLADHGLAAFLSQGPTPPRGNVVVVHPVTPAAFDGALGDLTRDLTLEFQTTAIGATAEQALWVNDTTAAALRSAALTGDGWATHPIWPVPGGSSPLTRDDTLATPLYVIGARWMAHTHPTT